MATQIQRRRGTTAQHSTFTGALGEITIDTDKDVVVVHDGSTVGGIPAAKEINGTLTQPTLVLKQGAAPTPTTEGDIQWDTDDNKLVIGDGATTKVISPDNVTAVISNKTINLNTNTLTGTVAEFNTALSDGNFAIAGANSDITSLTACTALTNASGVDIKGTNTNDSASAGDIGEYVESVVVSSTTGLTTATPANITSISLTAGDWDVFGSIEFHPAGTTTVSWVRGGISSTSATMPGDEDQAAVSYGSASTIPLTNPTFSVPTVRKSLAATTTIYLVINQAFGTSTAGAGGRISARRVR